MKQAEVKVGQSYLFHKTDIAHRKDLEGTIVKITGKKKRGKNKVYAHASGLPYVTGGYLVFKIEGNRNVAACELKELEHDNRNR